MENFIVSARKYRPENFNSVVGQQSITSTLKNAIKNNHLGHAYLFCGPRGVGKTTCARIFAKTINCYHLTNDHEPCNECESCKAFNESRSYNIHELDAASNNSVDDIRTLTEQVRIPPQIGKYSVFIIDEVHMLSQSAFNAFLKTLEEPPSHAVFILATTEKHKIIPTILSRCQIFDFNRIKVEDAVGYLEQIAINEKIEYEKEALHIIAQKADGAMRDALSIFDQVVSFSGKTIQYNTVIENLNILDYDYYFQLVDSFLEGNVANSILIFDEILDKGFDAHNFINGLAMHFRDLMVCKDPPTLQLLEVSENLRQQYQEQAKKCSTDLLYSALDICNQTDINYKISGNQRLLIELALVKLSNLGGVKKKVLTDHDENSDVINGDNEQNSIQGIGKKETESEMGSHNEAKKLPETHVPEKNQESVPQNPEINANKSKEDIPVPKKNMIRESGISIKDAFKVPDKNENANENGEAPEDSDDEDDAETEDVVFSQKELLIKWNEYADSIRKERPRIYSTLISKHPALKKDFKVSVSLDNKAQLEDFIVSIKHELTVFLRKELSNSTIELICQVDNDEKEGRKKIYTNEEKFQYLNKKNPNLNKLRQQFNLDFE